KAKAERRRQKGEGRTAKAERPGRSASLHPSILPTFVVTAFRPSAREFLPACPSAFLPCGYARTLLKRARSFKYAITIASPRTTPPITQSVGRGGGTPACTAGGRSASTPQSPRTPARAPAAAAVCPAPHTRPA